MVETSTLKAQAQTFKLEVIQHSSAMLLKTNMQLNTPAQSFTFVDSSTAAVVIDGSFASFLYRQYPAVFVSRGFHDIGRSCGNYITKTNCFPASHIVTHIQCS